MKNSAEYQAFVDYWKQGLVQPQISEGSSERRPAFDYARLDSDPDDIVFDTDNWNDIMLAPLRKFLYYVETGDDGYLSPEARKHFAKHFHFADTQDIAGIANSILVSNDGKIAVQWLYDNDENSFVIRFRGEYGHETYRVDYYKHRGRTENISGMAWDSEVVSLDELDTIYNVLGLKLININ